MITLISKFQQHYCYRKVNSSFFLLKFCNYLIISDFNFLRKWSNFYILQIFDSFLIKNIKYQFPTINTALLKSNLPFSQKLRNNGSSIRYTIDPLPSSCTPKISPSTIFFLASAPTNPLT